MALSALAINSELKERYSDFLDCVRILRLRVGVK